MSQAEIVPRATYRLQLNKEFGFTKALELLPYLDRLGISHLYLSPILKARAGSMHGYDTVDHRLINPELGTLDDFRGLAKAARARGMGIIVDFVPNHMGIGGTENFYWLSVLEHGQASPYAHWFDIDWASSDPSLTGKVLVPILGCSYAEALAEARLVLKSNRQAGRPELWVDETTLLPIDPKTYHLIGDIDVVNADRDQLNQLIQRQNWRLSRYSMAADIINYRRFFIVNELAGIRIEDPEVFDSAHALIFQLIAEGWVDGLRIDHIDGLFDPKAYAIELRKKSPRPIYLVVEKILAPHEQLRADWGVDGTTGYEFSAHLTALGSDPAGETTLSQAYRAFTGEHRSLAEIEREAKLTIIDTEMAAELDRLAGLAHDLARQNLATGDLTRNGLRNALRRMVAAMSIYRTYADATGTGAFDTRNVTRALALAGQSEPSLDPKLFQFLADRLAFPAGEFTHRLQQFTGPVMAKGLEDTALYRYNRLIALSDVGELPDRFSLAVEAFHDFNAARLARFPHSMLTTSTHDTKRGEDTRARILTLSGHADSWKTSTNEWLYLLGPSAEKVDRNTLWYFFQMLVGAWPTNLSPGDPVSPIFRDRMQAAMLKSAREARDHTSWTAPNKDYEDALAGLIELALADGPQNRFLISFAHFADSVGEAGARIGLAQAVLKLTVPGVPDIYRGAELREQSLVDPDNRRPVDFGALERLLDQQSRLDIAGWRDGSVKLAVIQRVLALRAEDPDLFAFGSYEPITAGAHIVAFLRRYEQRAIIVAVQLHPWRPLADALTLPQDLQDRRWREVFSELEGPATSQALAGLSVGVWVQT